MWITCAWTWKNWLFISVHYFFYHPFFSSLSVEFLGSVPPAVPTGPPAYAGKMRIDWPILGWCQVAFRPPRRHECSLSTSQWQTLGLERKEKKKGSKSERMKTEEGESRKTLVGPVERVVLLKACLFSLSLSQAAVAQRTRCTCGSMQTG